MAGIRILSTAEERRETILEAAERIFAARRLHGTPTIDIAAVLAGGALIALLVPGLRARRTAPALVSSPA
jgi:hypothetical protein